MAQKFLKSVWLFPALLAVLLFALTLLRIHGSSMGVYHTYFYGQTKDADLISGKPRPIRSDEWIVNSQMIIAQKANNYQRINSNIGNGQDMSVILDVPYKEWSQVFKPQNLAFLVAPFDFAFAFKWWLMGYLLIVSCYFFVVTVLKGKHLLAAALGLGLFFSPFVQWWYQYITLGPLYYTLFLATVFILLLRAQSLRATILYSCLLAYLIVCFALVLYPPFQIPCGIGLVAVCVGLLYEEYSDNSNRFWISKIAPVAGAVVLAGLVVGIFILTRLDTVHTIANTAYPGHRIVKSGGFDISHLLSGNLDYQLKADELAANYAFPKLGVTNQSEASSFFFLWPFLLVPGLFYAFRTYRRQHEIDLPLVLVSSTILLLLLWLFIPHLDLLGKLLFLDRVPHNRLIIGLGLLNIFLITFYVRHIEKYGYAVRKQWKVVLYGLAVFAAALAFNYLIKIRLPGFIGLYRTIAFALPAAVITYLLISRRYTFASAGIIAFALFMGVSVNPLYKKTAVLSNLQIFPQMQHVAASNTKAKWVIEDGNMENMAIMAGVPSLSGLYTYPQLNLWQPIDKSGRQEALYNRYAHVSINLDRSPTQAVPTEFIMPTFDHFGVRTEPCSSYLRQAGVAFALTEAPLPADDTCAKLVKSFRYPGVPFYMYQLN